MPAVAWTHTNKNESNLRGNRGRGKENWHWSEVIPEMKKERHLGRIVKGNTLDKGTWDRMLGGGSSSKEY